MRLTELARKAQAQINTAIMPATAAHPEEPALPTARRYGSWRRASQLLTLGVLLAIPALGLLRIDLASGTLLVLRVPVALRNFPAMAGLALVLATGPLVMVTTLGTLWCGWACPQNALAEWANRLTRRLLGSRADVRVDGPGWVVAPSKNRGANWLLLGANLLGASLLLGCIPLFYFLPPQELWGLVARNDDAQFAGFVLRLYLVSAGIVFVDIALVRNFLCNYACLYRIGTLLFGRDALVYVAYDAHRAAACARCNYCRVSCVTAIDPTAIGRFDRCINCAACIDACAQLHARDEPPAPGLLRFAATASGTHGRRRPWTARVVAALGWHGLVFIGGCVLLGYGLAG